MAGCKKVFNLFLSTIIIFSGFCTITTEATNTDLVSCLITANGVCGENVSKFEWSSWANNYYEVEMDGRKAAQTFANFNANSAGRANPGDKAKITFKTPIQLNGDEYLEFWMYSEKFAPTGVILDYGSWIDVSANVTADCWSFIKLPVKKGELKSIFLDYRAVKTENINDDTLFSIYISDVSIKRYNIMIEQQIVGTDGKFTDAIQAPNGANISSIQPAGALKWEYTGKPMQGSSFCPDSMTGSQKWVIRGTSYNGAIIRMQFKEAVDFTGLRGYGYLGFWLYTNAATTADLPDLIKLYDKSTYTVDVEFPKKSVKLNEWNYIKIPISEFTKNSELDMDFSSITNIELWFPQVLSGRVANECPECSIGSHTGSAANTSYDETKINDTLSNYAGTSVYDNSWFNIYISDMNVCRTSEYSGTIYKENRVLKDNTDIMDKVIFLQGSPYALVDGYKKECATPEERDGKTYLPYEFSIDALSIVDSSSITDVYTSDNGTVYAETKQLAQVSGKELYEKDGLIVFSDEEFNAGYESRMKIKNTISYRFGHLNLGAEGFITGMIIHPLDSDIRYVRTDVGGCYRWEKETDSWKQLMTVIPENQNNLVGIKSIAVDPNDTDIVYVFGGQVITRNSNGNRVGYHDVLKSYDRGETWQRTYLQAEAGGNVSRTRAHGESMAVDPNNSDIIYVGTLNDGLWYTDDGAKTWKKNTAIAEWIVDLGINIVMFNDDDIYVSVCGVGLYKSTDRGVSFEKMEGAPPYINRMSFVDGVLYAAVSGREVETTEEQTGGLFKYENNVWTNMTPDFDGIGDFVITDKYILISGEPWGSTSAYYRRSFDGGATWDQFKTGHGLNGCCCIVQNPDDEYSVYATTGEGVMLIKNLIGPLPGTADHALSNKPVKDENGNWSYELAEEQRVDDGSLMYIPSQSGIEELVAQRLMSVPHGDAPLLQIGCYDRGFIYTESKESLAIKGHDEGSDVGGMATGFDYCAEEPSFVLRTGKRLNDGNSGNVMVSEKYGRHRTIIYEPWGWKPAIGGALSADVKNDTEYPVILVLTADSELKGNGAIWRSYDWGQTWEKYDGIDVAYSGTNNYLGYTYDLLISDKVDGNAFYLINGSDFWVTRDCGNTWTNTYTFDVALNDSDLTAVPGKAGNIWLESNGYVWCSENYGTDWVKLDTIDECSSLSFGKGRDYLDAPALYINGAVGGVSGLYMSDDMGISWRRMDDDSINYAVAKRSVIAGDMNVYGRVFMSTAGHGVIYYEYVGAEEEKKAEIFAAINGEITDIDTADVCSAGDVLNIYAKGLESEESYIVVAAAYDENDILIDCTTFPQDKTAEYTEADYTVKSGAKTVRLMMWTSLETLKPHIKSTEIEVR